MLVSAGGVLIGLVAGWISARVIKLIDDPPVQIIISFLTPFAAYLPAERFGLSGVLAVVTAGVYVGWRTPEITDAKTRLQAYPFWEMVVFLLNGIIFILIGLQLPAVLQTLPGQSTAKLCGQAALISLAVILVRIIWVFPATYLPRYLSPRLRARDPYPGWRNVVIVAWTGMRGVVSLAAAMGLPVVLEDGRPFPGRDLILVFTFSVILATLVLQGLTLPFIIRKLEIHADEEADREERNARLQANRAAMVRLKELALEDSIPNELADRLHREYEDRVRELQTCRLETSTEASAESASPWLRLQQEALKVERAVILGLRNQRVISDDVMRRIERDLDLAEARLHPHASGH